MPLVRSIVFDVPLLPMLTTPSVKLFTVGFVSVLFVSVTVFVGVTVMSLVSATVPLASGNAIARSVVGECDTVVV